MNEKDSFALVPRPSSAVEKAQPVAKRVLVGMVGDTLALATKQQAAPPATKFRIGDYEWCEPDYRQILRWAEETGKSPEYVIQRLIDLKSSFEGGRLIQVCWDDSLMLLPKMRFVVGLKIKVFAFAAGARNVGIISTMMNPKPGVSPKDFEVAAIDLAGLTELERLYVQSQNLTELDLRNTPKMKLLRCESNSLSTISFSGLQHLEEVHVRNNFLSEIDLTNLPSLKKLECHQNSLSSLDLSSVPALEYLDCRENRWGYGNYTDKRIEVLDITPLKNIRVLKYDAGETRLLQRPDQHF